MNTVYFGDFFRKAMKTPPGAFFFSSSPATFIPPKLIVMTVYTLSLYFDSLVEDIKNYIFWNMPYH